MNAKPNIPDYEHRANLSLLSDLTKAGYQIQYSSRGYRVDRGKEFLGAATTLKKPHGRYREANTRDNLQSALRTALNYIAARKGVAV